VAGASSRGGTLARRIASRVASDVRRVDHLVGRLAGGRRILVEARTPLNLAVIRPVLERLRSDPRIRLQFTGPDRADLRAAFAELGVAGNVIGRRRALWRRFDLYVNSDPWEALVLRRVSRRLNFFHGVAGKYDLDCPANLPLGFDRYDAVAFPNAGRRNSYVAAGIVAANRARLIGYPKIDALVNGRASARRQAAALGLDPSRPTVIFAPTFSAASALNHAGEAIIETLITTGSNVIAKLHDRSLDPDPRYNGGTNWREQLRRFAAPHFLLAASGDSTPFVLASDVMVTDHSSIGFEFCALDRPLVVYDAPGLVETARINPEKVSLLRSAAAVVRDTRALADAVREALLSPRARADERARAAGAVFHQPGGATDRAVQLIYELIELPALAAGVEKRAGARAA
jgi:hypothetical protein